jgi:hypothetical protein
MIGRMMMVVVGVEMVCGTCWRPVVNDLPLLESNGAIDQITHRSEGVSNEQHRCPFIPKFMEGCSEALLVGKVDRRHRFV